MLENQNFTNLGKNSSQYQIDICIDEADNFIKNQIVNDEYHSITDSAVKGFANAISQSILGSANAKTNLVNNSILTTSNSSSNVIRSIGKNQTKPHNNKKNYIVTCLARRGLVVIGWK